MSGLICLRFRAKTKHGPVDVDLDVRRLATLSDGTFMEGPKPLRSTLKRLARLNRRLHRKVPRSKNRVKAAMRVARCHGRVASVRNDALHKLTTSLVRAYGCIVIEDLNVKGMIRRRKLSRVISDRGFGEFRRQLAYKVQGFRSEAIVVDRWFPSSRLCGTCGSLHTALILKEHVFRCGVCGHAEDRDLHAEDRDLNAAFNLERYPGLQGNPYAS